MPVSFDTVRDKNIMQLRKLNLAIFPVQYQDKFYTDALSSGDFTKLGMQSFIHSFMLAHSLSLSPSFCLSVCLSFSLCLCLSVELSRALYGIRVLEGLSRYSVVGAKALCFINYSGLWVLLLYFFLSHGPIRLFLGGKFIRFFNFSFSQVIKLVAHIRSVTKPE